MYTLSYTKLLYRRSYKKYRSMNKICSDIVPLLVLAKSSSINSREIYFPGFFGEKVRFRTEKNGEIAEKFKYFHRFGHNGHKYCICEKHRQICCNFRNGWRKYHGFRVADVHMWHRPLLTLCGVRRTRTR